MLLSARGKGDFILEKLQDNSVPTSDDLRQMHPFLLNDLTQAEEWDVFAPTFDFLREIAIQAAKIGELCAKIRETFRNQSHPPTRVQIAQSQQRVAQARDVLRQRWNSQVPAQLAAALGQQRLSGKARDAYEHVSDILHADPGFCLLYECHNISLDDATIFQEKRTDAKFLGKPDIQCLHNIHPYQHVADSTPGHRALSLRVRDYVCVASNPQARKRPRLPGAFATALRRLCSSHGWHGLYL